MFLPVLAHALVPSVSVSFDFSLEPLAQPLVPTCLNHPCVYHIYIYIYIYIYNIYIYIYIYISIYIYIYIYIYICNSHTEI
jgi:hypothetical protein